MSTAGFPIPIATPPLNGKAFSEPWARYFKWLGDDNLQANKFEDVRGVPGARYTINANACLLSFEASAALVSPVEIPLPMRSLAPFEVRTDTAAEWYPSQSKTVTIPVGARFAQAWYIVDPRATRSTP